MTLLEFELLVQRLRYMQSIEIKDANSVKLGLYLGSYNRNNNSFKFLNKETNEVENISILDVSIKIL